MNNLPQRCLACRHTVRDPNPTPEQVILGRVGAMCLGAPPTAALMPAQGGMALVAIYPMVDANTYSCAAWAPIISDMNG